MIGLLAALAQGSKPRAAAEDTWAAGLASVLSKRDFKFHVVGLVPFLVCTLHLNHAFAFHVLNFDLIVFQPRR